jgi:diguanylate cyclase (GGDEF)-like protein
MLLIGHADDLQIMRYACYRAIAACLTTLLREFMRRNLLEQLRLQRQLRWQATTDGLTGLLLRGRFFQLAARALDQARHAGKLVCMDADHFKRLNDQHGHAAGDQALIALADCLLDQIREGDLIGRVGGEQFAILLPGLDLQQAGVRAEQLREAVHGVLRPDGLMTVSIDLAASLPLHEGVEALLARANKAMARPSSTAATRWSPPLPW